MNPPVIEHIADENRDPKVYWHEKSQAYYMVLFLEGNQFGIFRSENLQSWVCTQTLELDKAWECPDLREIPVEGGGSKWVFWSADGFYFLGEFDGFQFMTDGIRREAYQTLMRRRRSLERRMLLRYHGSGRRIMESITGE